MCSSPKPRKSRTTRYFQKHSIMGIIQLGAKKVVGFNYTPNHRILIYTAYYVKMMT